MNAQTAVCSLGIDIGTSSVKVGLLDIDSGQLIHVSQRKYDSSALQYSRIIWRETLEALKDTVGAVSDRRSITAAGLSGQMHGTVLYNHLGRVIDPIINWQDKRCDQPLLKYLNKTTIEIISEQLADVDTTNLGVDKIASGFLGATLFYIKENQQALYKQIRHVTLPTDFIRGKLLGKFHPSTDPSNACSTGLFNIKTNSWHTEVLQVLGLDYSMLPRICGTSQFAGEMDWLLTQETGLRSDFPIIYGGGDLQMSILGSGVFEPGSPDLLNIGTGAQIARVSDGFDKLPTIDTWPYFFGNYLNIGASLGGGASYQWLRNHLRSEMDMDLQYWQMDELAERVPPCANGLRFCTGPTRQDPKREFGFYGDLTKQNDPGCMARAVMEGVIKDLWDYYQQMGENEQGWLVGAGNGLGHNRTWPQIASEMFGKSLQVVNTENAVYGAALMADYAAGSTPNLAEAVENIPVSVFHPDPKNVAKYQEITQIKSSNINHSNNKPQ